MEFGVTVKPVIEPDRIVSLMRKAEMAGFKYGWLFDSHILRMEPYPLLTMIALQTTSLRLGTCVTNPITRDPSVTGSMFATLNRISGGRMELGIGRGDSSLRLLGKKPATLAQLEAAVHLMKDLTAGRQATYKDQTVQLQWMRGTVLPRPPIWIAGYGPKVLYAAGRLADGVILQFADPDLIKWCLEFVRAGAQAAGRNPTSIKIMAAAPVWVSENRATAVERLRWFPSVVSNHVVEMIARYGRSALPETLTNFVRHRTSYDYKLHGNIGTPNAAFVPDEVVNRFCITGSISQHCERLVELSEIGVDQFNLYLMSGDEEQTIDIYGSHLIPALK